MFLVLVILSPGSRGISSILRGFPGSQFSPGDCLNAMDLYKPGRVNYL